MINKNMANKIPSSFKLFGETITVEYDPAMLHNEDVYGWASYRQDKIILQPRSEQIPITEEALQQAFFHEMMHHILYLAGEESFDPPLHKREYLVNRIASLLQQALHTAEFDAG